MIANEKSVFPVLCFDGTHGWDALLGLVKPELDVRGLNRLRNVLEGHCKCIVIERHYIDKDYRDTFSNFHSKRFSTPSSRCVRLHFFADPVDEAAIAEDSDAMRSAYLGYCVVRPTKPNCIGRMLLTHRLRADTQAHVSHCEERVHLLGTRLSVEGFPFISQDADATVCAQSALWMLLRYYSNRYEWYSEILPFQITNLAANHASGSRVYPSAGLYSWQLAEALRLQRFSPVVYSRQQFRQTFEHLLYTYIESGLPLLITVPGHVVVAHGHSSDYTVPLPAAPGTWTYSSAFNRAFIVSDDNFHPYQALREGGPVDPVDSAYSWGDIEEFIVPLPEKAFLTAEHAQSAIEAVLNDATTGIAVSSPSLLARPLLLRLFLTSARSFKRSLRTRGMGHSLVEELYRRLPMPHFIWICEIADCTEYTATGQILGEVIWDATRNAHEPDGWIALHYPEKLFVDTGAAFNRRQNVQSIPLDAANSYSLFKSNLHTL